MYEMDEKCRKCKNNGTAICNRCDMYYDEFNPIDKPKQTNADRIRAMTDEELADFLWSRDIDIVEKASRAVEFTYHCDEDVCRKNILDWLKEEAENGNQNKVPHDGALQEA